MTQKPWDKAVRELAEICHGTSRGSDAIEEKLHTVLDGLLEAVERSIVALHADDCICRKCDLHRAWEKFNG